MEEFVRKYKRLQKEIKDNIEDICGERPDDICLYVDNQGDLEISFISKKASWNISEIEKAMDWKYMGDADGRLYFNN